MDKLRMNENENGSKFVGTDRKYYSPSRSGPDFKQNEKNSPLKEKIKNRFARRNDALKKLNVTDELINDVGANCSGMYELIAVLTHTGRSAESGHYVAWTKYGNCWYKVDDGNVSVVTTDQIQKLSGGGDWHSAYICIYKSREMPLIN